LLVLCPRFNPLFYHEIIMCKGQSKTLGKWSEVAIPGWHYLE